MGNKLGWIIAGVMLAGLIGYILSNFVFPSPSEPTSATMRLGVLDLHAPAKPIETVLGFAPSQDQDAGEDYSAAIAFYNQHREEFEAMFDRLRNDEIATLDLTDLELCRTLLQLLEPAANKKEMAYTFVYTPTDLKVSAFADGATDFERLSNTLQTVAEHYKRTNQLAESVKPAQALFIMGWHMMNERRRYQIVASGMDYQNVAIQILQEAYRNADDAEKLQAAESYLSELVFAHKLTTDKQSIVWTFDPKPGDIFNIIENDKDRTWRIEGTLALGMLKLRQKGNRGNMRKIEQLFTTTQAGDDEIIRAAGKVAQSCTSDQITSWQN